MENYTTLSFSGTTKDYFCLWLKSALLTLITLGFYLPWAIVKCRKYIIHHTNNAIFTLTYTASPLFFLRWYFVLVGIVGAVGLLHYLSPQEPAISQSIFILLGWGILPYFTVNYLRYHFNSLELNTVRFQFKGKRLTSYAILLIIPFICVITFAIIFVEILRHFVFMDVLFQQKPSYFDAALFAFAITLIKVLFYSSLFSILIYYFTRFLFLNSYLGAQRFHVNLKKRVIIGCFFLAVLIYVVAVLIVAFLLGEFFLALYFPIPLRHSLVAIKIGQLLTFFTIIIMPCVIAAGFYIAMVRNSIYNSMKIGDIKFISTLDISAFIWLYLSNSLLIFLTLGLYIPIAKLRHHRYLLAHTQIINETETKTQPQ